MIKKLQIKFVATTMSILLVVFIAVLGSINLIMQSMMQSQSRLVLNQIASNIRYDEDTSTFSFKVKPDSEEMKNEPADTRPDLPQNPSENTVTERPTENTKPSTEAETSTTAPELTEPDAAPENTEAQPAQVIPDEQVIAPESPEINTPNETEAAITTAVAENNPEITMTTPAVQNPTNNNTPQPDTSDNIVMNIVILRENGGKILSLILMKNLKTILPEMSLIGTTTGIMNGILTGIHGITLIIITTHTATVMNLKLIMKITLIPKRHLRKTLMLKAYSQPKALHILR